MMCKDGACGGMKMCAAHKVAKVLVLIGSLNWLLIGLGGFMNSDWNVVHMLLGSWPMVEWVVYIIVGLAALMMCTMKKCCMKGGCGSCKGGECKGEAGAASCKAGSCKGGASCNGQK